MREEYGELRGERLRLRPPRADDVRQVFESFAADPEVTRFLTWRPHGSLEDAERALAGRLQRLAKGVEYSWMLEPVGCDRLVGIVSAWIADGAAELGFVLARSHWKQGLATEAARLVKDWAFGLPDVERVWASCDVENRASARVLEKAGLANAGEYARDVVRPNLDARPRPSLLFVAERAGASALRGGAVRRGDGGLIRALHSDVSELAFLEEMLFEAFFWSPHAVRPALAAFRQDREFRKLLAGWGRAGDCALVASEAGERAGAAWYRLWTAQLHSYGFVDAATPELGIAVAPARRSRGLGGRLLDALIERASADGFPALSLSVDPANRARTLYESRGFHKVGESGTSWTMLLPIA